MSSDLIRFLADSADELVSNAQAAAAPERAARLAEASELLCLAARLTRRSAREEAILREAA